MKYCRQSRLRLPSTRPLVTSLALAMMSTTSIGADVNPYGLRTDAAAWPIAQAYLQTNAASPPPSVTVLNCDDSGPGSLREAYSNAIDGSVIDMRDLKCSKITLTSGPLTDQGGVAQSDANAFVQIFGSGQTIDGAGKDRVIVHLGADGLGLRNLTITNGVYTGSKGGGCIYSLGGVALEDQTVVSACHLTALMNNAYAKGGGVYSKHRVSIYGESAVINSTATSLNRKAQGGGVWARDVRISHSTISGNNLDSNVGSAGGGVFAGDDNGNYSATVSFSTISDNRTGDFSSSGGGLYVAGALSIFSSTISGNHANYGGGVYGGSTSSFHPEYFNQNTVSGNTASFGGGAMFKHEARISNCTITKNDASSYAGGVLILAAAAKLDSSIVAGNTSYMAGAADLKISSTASVSGYNNIVIASSVTTLTNTIVADPMLQPLQNNGGPTKTHALLRGSAAIDMGGATHGPNDQRGDPYPRVVGANMDIGAFEYVPPDHVFDDSFDLRPGERLFKNGFD